MPQSYPQTKAKTMDCLKHSLNLSSRPPSDKGKPSGLLEIITKFVLKATLRQRQKQWIAWNIR